jgi:hypothetical protein
MGIQTWNFLERLGDKVAAGTIGVLAAAALQGNRFATVATTGAGNLKVSTWEVGHDGSVKILDEASRIPRRDP